MMYLSVFPKQHFYYVKVAETFTSELLKPAQYHVNFQSIHDPMREAVSVALGRLTDELTDSVNSLLYDGDYVLREDNAGDEGELPAYVQVRKRRLHH